MVLLRSWEKITISTLDSLRVGLKLFTTCRPHTTPSYGVGSAIRVLSLDVFGGDNGWEDEGDPFYNDRYVVTARSSFCPHNTATNRSLENTFIGALLCLDRLQELSVAFPSFICSRDYDVSSLKFLHTARLTLHPYTAYELVDALSLFSKIPQLKILWLRVIMGQSGEYALLSAGDLTEHSVVVPIFFQATLTELMIHGDSRHVHIFSMIHCPGVKRLHLACDDDEVDKEYASASAAPHWIADIVSALNRSACHLSSLIISSLAGGLEHLFPMLQIQVDHVYFRYFQALVSVYENLPLTIHTVSVLCLDPEDWNQGKHIYYSPARIRL
jgi:hypothetical protein